MDEREILRADGPLDGLVLGGVVVDERLVHRGELGLPSTEQGVLPVGGLCEHGVVQRG